MTTAIRNRCVHCKSPYVFHPSFYGGDEENYPYNHQDYCPECYKIVAEALAKVTVKYEKRFIPADKYTREQIVEHQEERCSKGLPMRRILVPMFGSSGRHMQVCELMPDEQWYRAEWWTNEPDKVGISVETWCLC